MEKLTKILTKIILIILAIILVAFIICTIISVTGSITMQIPSLNIDTTFKRAYSQVQAQEFIDDPNCGAYYGKYLADHSNQSFANLHNIEIGATAIINGKNYKCTFVTTGYSIEGLQPEEGQTIPYADFYAITCTDVKDYQVWVIGLCEE